MAAYKYTCVECGAQAKKEPLKAVPGYLTAPTSDFIGLGTWWCTKQNKKVKVRRTNERSSRKD